MTNILFLMSDQMQGRVFEPGHICQTPNLDRVIARGMRFSRAYTPNPVCSPARASLMTGLLPHNHGVWGVYHCFDDDQCNLRIEHPHWAQRLEGYKTGYFGKWHVERSNQLERFGWQSHGATGSKAFAEKQMELVGDNPSEPNYSLALRLDNIPGYRPDVFYGVTSIPPEQRTMGIVTSLAADFLDDALEGDDPWCCFVSVTEPHDPFICGEEAFNRYNVEDVEIPANWRDDLANSPAIYRRSARAWAHMTERHKQEAATCYYASITEIDSIFGKLIDKIDAAGQLDDTIIVITSDHGEMLGAHGLYCKNIGAYEETYHIPLIIAGPGVQTGETNARVGLHDVGSTLLELTGKEPIDVIDSKPFANVLRDPEAYQKEYVQGFAEYSGQRMLMTQRVVWNGDWKFVFNGFDFDELYNLSDDPGELHNLAADPDCQEKLQQMTKQMWEIVTATGDHALYNTHYAPYRTAAVGPLTDNSKT